MITCCELALVLCGVILAMLAMFFNYNLKLKDKAVELTQRTNNLEKKNGHEQHQLDELTAKLNSLENLFKQNLLTRSLTDSASAPLSPIPPLPQPKPKTPLVPKTPATDWVAELKAKQQAGKVKPSDFKKS